MSVTVTGVAKTFTGRRAAAPVAALHPLDLDVAETELVVVVGPSGSGKSTLLRVIAGLEAAGAGTVRIGGRDVTAVPPGARDVALVFQEPALFPHLRIGDNIGFGERARGTPRGEVRSKVAALRSSDRKDQGRVITIIASMGSLVRNRVAASRRMARSSVLGDRGIIIMNSAAALAAEPGLPTGAARE